ADYALVVFEVVEERAAARGIVQRPAEGMLDLARLVLGRVDLPELLQADAVFLRLAAGVQLVAGDQRLRQAAARALGEQRISAAQLHAAGEARFWLAVAADAHVAGRDTDHRARVVEQHFGRGEARIDLDAER